MLALKEKNDKDIAQYKTEFMELERIIDHERKLKEFMRVKGEERAEMMEGELTSRRKKKDEKDKGDKAEETIVVSILFRILLVIWETKSLNLAHSRNMCCKLLCKVDFCSTFRYNLVLYFYQVNV